MYFLPAFPKWGSLVISKQIRTKSHGRYDAGSNSILIAKKELTSEMYFLRLHFLQKNGMLVIFYRRFNCY